MSTIKIPKQNMLDILDGGADVVRNRIIDHGRWSVTHEMIFRRGDKLYRATYRVGATESQDESPWEHDKEVEAKEVWEVEELAIHYQIIV